MLSSPFSSDYFTD